MGKLFRIILLRLADTRQALLTIGCFLIFLNFLLLMPAARVWGISSPGRMVLVNGQIHRIWISNQYMYHQAGLPENPVNGTGNFVAAVDADGVTIPADKGPYICRYHTLASVEGLAVFNNKIFVAYTKDTTCGTSGNMSAYIAAFDLLGNADYPHGHWYLKDYRLGSVKNRMASGAAITVFNGQLFVFTDSGTYTSSDGTLWGIPHAPLDSTKQPLDAVTIYPEVGGPQILLVFGTGTADDDGNYFEKLYAATWDGVFGSPLEYPSCAGGATGCLINPIVGDKWIAGRVALLPGTRKADPTITGSTSGYKVLAVQLFAQLMNDTMRIREYRVNEKRWHRIYDPQTSAYEPDYSKFTGLMVYPWYVSACDPDNTLYQARHQRFVALGGSVRPVFDSDYLVPINDPSPYDCDAAEGISNPTTDDDETTRKYWSLVGVVLGSPPFSLNGARVYSEVKDISNVVYSTESSEKTEVSQQWTHQSMISTGVEVHAGFFDEKLKITESFDATFKHDWESTYKDVTEQSVSVEDRMGTESYTEGALYPLPYSTCKSDADCEDYADPYAGDEPACNIYNSTGKSWDPCNGNEGCVCTVSSTGKTGWALFNAPTIYVQDFEVYAYDYDKTNGYGTSLDQDLHTIEAKGFSLVNVTFDLQHPELARRIINPDGSIKPKSGILTGMQPFPYSTDLDGWNNQDWGRNDMPWKVLLGSGNINTVSHENTSNISASYAEKITSVKEEGQTESIELLNKTELEVGMKLKGFKLGLSVGKDSSYSTSESSETSLGKEAKASIGMPYCTPGTLGCVTKLTVQPYLLQATGKAPWIPDLYPVVGDRGPWCMTWALTSACPDGPNCTTTLVNPIPEGLPPLNAFGRIIGGNGGGTHEKDRYSYYIVKGGRLAWVDAQGVVERIPMTADDFVPSKGVTIDINGKSWSTSGNEKWKQHWKKNGEKTRHKGWYSSRNGSWKRRGNIWTFQTDPKVRQNRVLLRLDFGSATYDLIIQKADLEGHVFAGMTDVNLRLIVNDDYVFSSTIHHDVDIRWQWNEPPADNLVMHVTSFQGRYESATESGKMTIEGTLPDDLTTFGDVAMVINGHKTTIPLISMDEFQEAFQYGGVFKYSKNGLILDVDFGDKTWSATFKKQAFRELHAPRWGKMGAKILVGGLPWVNREDAVLDYSANLTFHR